MDALLAYSDDDDDGGGSTPASALQQPQLVASQSRPAAAKPGGVVVFKLPSMRGADADERDLVPPPPRQPEDAGAKRPRDGDRKSAFLSSLPAPKNAAAKPSTTVACAAAAVAPAPTAAAPHDIGADLEFEVDAAAYSDGSDGSDDSSHEAAPPLSASAALLVKADDEGPALGPSFPPPDYYAYAYPEAADDEQLQGHTLDYSNPIFDQSVPVEGAVLAHLRRELPQGVQFVDVKAYVGDATSRSGDDGYVSQSAFGKQSRLSKQKHQITAVAMDLMLNEKEILARNAAGQKSRAAVNARYGW